jgi:hypothetical protein
MTLSIWLVTKSTHDLNVFRPMTREKRIPVDNIHTTFSSTDCSSLSDSRKGVPPMRKARVVVVPRLDALEDRVALSHYGSQLLSSATAEIRKLHTSLNNKSIAAGFHHLTTGLNKTLHDVQHTVNHQVTSVVHHVQAQKSTNSFWNSIKSIFGFK